MSQIKTQGLIIKACNLNDNDKIFTVITRQGEKLSLMSKGIRSQKHKDFSALQLFCYSDLIIEKRVGLGYVTGASVINNFFEIRNSVEKVAFATYVSELVGAIPDDTGFSDEFYNFILNTLYMTGKADNDNVSKDILKLKAIFEICLATELGFMPVSKECRICLSKKDIKYFDISDGGVYCDKCFEQAPSPSLVPINDNVFGMLAFILSSDLRKVFKLSGELENLKILNKISEMYLQHHTEIAPTALYYLKNIIKIG